VDTKHCVRRDSNGENETTVNIKRPAFKLRVRLPKAPRFQELGNYVGHLAALAHVGNAKMGVRCKNG
jgi:hypothetical protein